MRLPLLAALLCVELWAPEPAIVNFDVPVPMRDGVHLSTNVFRPRRPARVPTILIRTPYRKGDAISSNWQAFIDHGYAVVVQDVRGRFESEGVFRPLDQEGPDGYDTIEWIARQPWSDGKVGMTGGSYLGIVQWKAALTGNPHLKAIFPWVSGNDDYFDRFYSPGGAVKLGQRLVWMAENLRIPGYRPDFNRYIWHLPLRTSDRAATGDTSPMFHDAISHPAYDDFWRRISTRASITRVKAAVFSVGGWYDNFVRGDLESMAVLRRISGVHRILIGPWAHDMRYRFEGVDFGPGSTVPLRTLQLMWFDQWLKGKDTAVLSEAPVRVFVMGANRWREDHQWPPADARMTPWYLQSHGRANTLSGDGILGAHPTRQRPPDRFVYDPQKPVPTRGGAVCCNPRLLPWGPLDQRPVESRRDVLVYTSQPLPRDMEVTGPVQAVLWVSTSAPDTDFTAKLVDVFPDGQARILTDGILRLRYRDSLERPLRATPGEIYRIAIDAGVTSNLFRKGHRMRLEVSSSNFPRFDRNLNTGGSIPDETRSRKAEQIVYHDPAHPSHVLLPVITEP
ncbi:MAG TPA: CocE/NonD family hydrolase [Bryobacteraceae bacterium]|nr:CocE/NonD family hydrolase [Bryobacteraceae bacterium]